MRVFLYWKAGSDNHERSQRNTDVLSALQTASGSRGYSVQGWKTPSLSEG
jgi:hypothetical protein